MRVDQLTAQRQLRIMIYYLYLIKQIRFYFFPTLVAIIKPLQPF